MIRFDTKKHLEHYDYLYRENYIKDREIKRLKEKIEITYKKIHHALAYMENCSDEPSWHYVYEILQGVDLDEKI